MSRKEQPESRPLNRETGSRRRNARSSWLRMGHKRIAQTTPIKSGSSVRRWRERPCHGAHGVLLVARIWHYILCFCIIVRHASKGNLLAKLE